MNKDPAKPLSPFVFHSEKFYALGLMTNRIAHEINNSMQGILLLVNFLEMDYPSNENIALLSQEIYKIKNLVQSLSNYAKADTLEFKPLDLTSVINETVALLKNLTGYSALTKTNSSAGPFMVKGNFFYLQLAFLNLLFHCCSQAASHKNSSNNIEIELGTNQQQDHTVLIRPQSSKNKKKSPEIKLDLVQNIFQLHSGKLQAIDKHETSFIVTLPGL